jgi:ferredoxin-NADP reductase
MLMPEQTPKTDLIMVATGTGIAPYRSFIRRLFVEKTPAGAAYSGQAWLFLGVANSDSLLYDNEWQAAKAAFPANFRLDYALSREQNNSKGGKMYIQDKERFFFFFFFTTPDSQPFLKGCTDLGTAGFSFTLFRGHSALVVCLDGPES